jgi:hypothetical protein
MKIFFFLLCSLFLLTQGVDAQVQTLTVKQLPINPNTVCNGLKGADRTATLAIVYAYSTPSGQPVACTSTGCPNNSGFAYCVASVYQCIC